ncbi:MAG: hypothetical protein ACRD3E_14250 [Terriglobales bacterium]
MLPSSAAGYRFRRDSQAHVYHGSIASKFSGTFMISDSDILKKIAQQPKRAAGFKQLARELGVHGDERAQLQEHLSQLVTRGELTEDGDRYALPQPPSKNQATGRLSMHRDGYGFVTPDSASLRDRIAGDIYIPPPAVGSAMHGDRVLV